MWLLFFVKKYARNSTMDTLTISVTWKEKKPNLSHLVAPPALIPAWGMRITVRRIIDRKIPG
jgi:hypothetical protein